MGVARRSGEPLQGYAKDHRPDVKQAVLELMVSQDGGVPLMSKSWDGHPSDTQVFQERARALIETLKKSPSPRYLVADCKLYHEDNAEHLKSLGFITRIPHTLKVVSRVIRQALEMNTWQPYDDTARYQCLELCHFGMEQRWLVVHSEAAAWRAEADEISFPVTVDVGKLGKGVTYSRPWPTIRYETAGHPF